MGFSSKWCSRGAASSRPTRPLEEIRKATSGHVQVFSFIQRFFPGFYPSCFSEKQLRLRKLSSDVLSTSEESLLGAPVKPTQDGVPRVDTALDDGLVPGNSTGWFSKIAKLFQ